MFWACRLANSWSSCALVDMLLCDRCYSPLRVTELSGMIAHVLASCAAGGRRHVRCSMPIESAAARSLLVRGFRDKAVSLRHALGR